MALFLTGTTGNDTLIGGTGADTLIGNAGNDYLDGGAGGDSLLGGTGNDTYVVDSIADIVTESALEGTDQVLSAISYTLGNNLEALTLTGTAAINGTGNNLGNTLQGNAANNVLTGGSGADFLLGNGGNDTLVGGAGDDYLNGGVGLDSMVGGLGDDVYVVDSAGDLVVETAGQGYDEVRSSVSYALSATQEVELVTLTGTATINATGNSLDNDLAGNGGHNLLQGLAGNDWMSGGLGNDTLDGGTGNDTLDGGAGNDTYYVDSVYDQVLESSITGGTDQIFSSVSYSLQGKFIEKLTLTGAENINGTGNNQGNTLIGNAGNNQLNSGTGSDVIYANAGNDSISSGAGNDYIDGGAGQDTMAGGQGDDIYVIDNLNDHVIEASGEGWDTLILGANINNFSLRDTPFNAAGNNIEAVKVFSTNSCTVFGDNSDNSIIGNSGNDFLFGYGGNDTIYGNGGNDTLWGGGNNAKLYGGDGDDELDGKAEIKDGGNGNDVIICLDSSTVIGGLGDDEIGAYKTSSQVYGQTYYWGRGEGRDRLQDAGGEDTLNIFNGVTDNQIWLTKTNADLKISIIGSYDSFTIMDWFTSTSNQVESIKLADGKTLNSTRVQGLVDAMSQFNPPISGTQTAPAELASAIATAWI